MRILGAEQLCLWRGVKMRKINFGRMLAGGLVAGVIINIAEGLINGLFLGSEWKQWALSKGPLNQAPSQATAMGIWTLVAFALGILGVWLYAAIRPRYGAGPKTAIRAGLFLWVIYWLLVALQHLALGTVPSHLLWLGTWGGLIGELIAMLAGAAIYKEAGDPSSYAPAPSAGR